MKTLPVVRGALALLALVPLGCASPGAWELRFATSTLAERTERIELEIRRGGCGGVASFQDVVARAETPAMAPTLPTGRVGFWARARDEACLVVAEGCTELDVPLPGGTIVVTELREATGPGCAASESCVDGACDGALDAGAMDADLSDAAAPDAASLDAASLDAHDARSDSAASDGGPDANGDAGLTITSLSSGPVTACVTWSDGVVECWGSDGHGQLGDGPGTPSATAVVAGLSDATTVSVGDTSACATRASGRVACWGSDGLGLLGDGAGATASDLPVETILETLTPLTNVREVWVSVYFAVARDGDGRLHFWGTFASRPPYDTSQWAAPFYEELAAVDRVFASNFGVCVLDTDGTLLCAGENTRGLLARPVPDAGVALDAGMAPDAGVEYPMRGTLPPLMIDDLGLGARTACAVMLDQTVRCWGSNEAFVIRTTDQGAIFETPVTLPALARIVDVGTADAAACALDTEGRVWCWGSNTHGHLGVTDTGVVRAPGASMIGLPASATALSVGPFYACAVVAGRDLWCWGRDQCGILSGSSTSGLCETISDTVVVPRRVALRR